MQQMEFSANGYYEASAQMAKTHKLLLLLMISPGQFSLHRPASLRCPINLPRARAMQFSIMRFIVNTRVKGNAKILSVAGVRRQIKFDILHLARRCLGRWRWSMTHHLPHQTFKKTLSWKNHGHSFLGH